MKARFTPKNYVMIAMAPDTKIMINKRYEIRITDYV